MLVISERIVIVVTIVIVISEGKPLVVLSRLYFASIALLSKGEIEIIALEADPILIVLIMLTMTGGKGMWMRNRWAVRHILFFIYLISGILKIILRTAHEKNINHSFYTLYIVLH